MKANQAIPKTEIFKTRLALLIAMQDVGQAAGCEWLSSRPGSGRPDDLTEVLGGSGYFNSKTEKRTNAN